MKLTDRMQGVADLVTPGLVLADIGTDHSYLPIYLVKNEIVPKAIAMDVNKGPLAIAQEHIEAEGLSDRITTRLSDGLVQLNNDEAQSVIVAGMGGRLILKILSESKHQWEMVKEFILQPQSELELFRRQMEVWGFVCQEENMIFDDGKYYPMGRYVFAGIGNISDDLFCKQEVSFDDFLQEKRVYYRYGEGLIKTGNPVLRQYLEKEALHLQTLEEQVLKSADSEKKFLRIEEIKKKQEDNQYALNLLPMHK